MRALTFSLVFWLLYVALFATLYGCAIDSDPRGVWRMEEWRSERHEGGAFHHSRNRPWSEGLSL